MHAATGPPFVAAEEPLDGRTSVIAVAGELDIRTAPDLKAAIGGAVDRGARVIVLDLTDTTFVDSMGLSVFIGAVKRLQPLGGRLAVVTTEPHTTKTFAITGLDRVFPVVETRTAALAAVGGPRPAR